MSEPQRQVWKVMIEAPIDVVWSTLVKTDEVLPFLFGGICDSPGGLEPGKPMRMLTPDGRSVIAFGEVLEFSPPHRFSHAINFATAADEPAGKTTYTLREVPGGTELTLISEALAGSRTARMARSGQFIVDNLKAWTEQRRLTPGGRMITLMGPLVRLFTPARCRVEHRPLSRVPLRPRESRTRSDAGR